VLLQRVHGFDVEQRVQNAAVADVDLGRLDLALGQVFVPRGKTRTMNVLASRST